jgi:hypothetical protein
MPGSGSSESAENDLEANGNASQEFFERIQAYEETARLQYDVGMTQSTESQKEI